MQCVLKNFEETGQMEDSRRYDRPKKKTAADQQHLKIMSIRNREQKSSKDETQNMKDAGPGLGLQVIHLLFAEI